MTASDDTLHTAELLELILTNLDPRTLLLAQRMSTYWRDLIINSPPLQKKLFLRPATTQELFSLAIAPPRNRRQAVDMIHLLQSGVLWKTTPPVSSFAVLNPLLA
ncbi:hypothetical protein CLAFUW4_11690 [Fulvia fulva]|uniref:uncharacterized protein n=1 Tax=Passalora fulva TaxID=5499 RepID=UPI002852511C|nr:uncharacterized protein CLAFUR5_20318 [Fulvia fulva]KAK4619530.1 hypothetical protein CLAFUR4_11695 [Fulvia fulva]KAK4620249.1 hypothetical protein CLAFUR0_11707 [Fulvia fulva]WMI38966.1 hypothetical protein CLAFUR5_20318 [Fulvia fulva]WPV17416.1 hypothetical protein CLAFUW4_11690 [Fulvia fulva]WPV32274.1 hypothetical protein CLAFUW7_11697 [Fulvia fulva]